MMLCSLLSVICQDSLAAAVCPLADLGQPQGSGVQLDVVCHYYVSLFGRL